MSDPIAEALMKVLDRLDAIEERLSSPSAAAGTDEFPDWNEDSESALIEKGTAIERSKAAHPSSRLHRPADMQTIALDESTQWVPGEAMLPVSDQPISLGTSSGHRMTPAQIQVAYQREMIAPMRARPVEDR